MRKASIALLCTLTPALALAGCTSDDSGAGPGPLDASGADVTVPVYDAGGAHDSGGDTSVADSSLGDASTADGNARDTGVADTSTSDGGDAGPTGAIRVANLAPGGAAIDFCVTPTASGFDGAPHMGAAGVAAGLAYGQVSEYVGIPGAAGYLVRLVAAGAVDCTTALAGTADTSIASVTVDHPATVALLGIAGDATAPLSVHALIDDGAPTAPAGGLRLRIVHAAPHQPATDFQIGAGAWTSPLQTGIAYGQVSAAATATSGAPTTDAQGYLTTPIDSAQITATQAAAEITSGYDIEARTGSTFFVGDGSAGAPLGTVQCDDTAPPTAHLSACTLRTGAPTLHKLRFLDLAPTGTVEACLRMGDVGTFGAGLLATAGITGGATYATLTGKIVTYPDWTSYDALFVPHGTACSVAGELPGSEVGSAQSSADETITLVPNATAGAYYTLVTTADNPDPGDVTTANVALTNNGFQTGAETVAFYVSPTSNGDSGVQVLLGPASLAPYNSFTFATVPPGTYQLVVRDSTTSAPLVTTGNVVLNANTSTSFHFFAPTAGTRAVARCDLGEPQAGTLTACSH